MKLYHCKPSRSTRALWMIEEVGAPCELVDVNLFAGEQRKPEYLRIHPHGVVPALVDGEQTVFESSAIVMYLADKYPEKKLLPGPGSLARAKYYQWAVYGPATVDPLLEVVGLNTMILPENMRNPEAARAAKEKFKVCGDVISSALQGNSYLLGASFSAADVIVGYCCFWANFCKMLGGYPMLEAYLERLLKRPAFQKALAGARMPQ